MLGNVRGHFEVKPDSIAKRDRVPDRVSLYSIVAYRSSTLCRIFLVSNYHKPGILLQQLPTAVCCPPFVSNSILSSHIKKCDGKSSFYYILSAIPVTHLGQVLVRDLAAPYQHIAPYQHMASYQHIVPHQHVAPYRIQNGSGDFKMAIQISIIWFCVTCVTIINVQSVTLLTPETQYAEGIASRG